MSDPILRGPTNPSSSPPTQLDEPTRLKYAFLIHSQKTLTENLPPRVDNKLLARQKRRRTSPEDHAVLEAEYLKNPKPDKAARVDIVNRVSLGEKEVQIWFQNRRQNDRRKSKPFDPNEPLGPSSSEPDLSQPSNTEDSELVEPEMSSGREQPDSQDQAAVPSELPIKPSTDEVVTTSSSESDVPSEERPDPNPDPDQSLDSSQTSLASLPHEPPDPQAPTAINNDSDQAKEGSDNSETVHVPGTPPASAKRKRAMSDVRGCDPPAQQSLKPGDRHDKSPPSLRLSLSLDGEARVRKEGDLTPSPPRGRNALRIAMSSDGKAVIRAGNEPSPSKNRISMFSNQTPRFPGLRRSSSAVIFGTPHVSSADRDKIFGRSRDPRNWESFFDTDARSALSTTPTSSQPVPSSHHSSPALSGSQPRRSLTRSFSAARPNMPPPRSTTISHPFGEKRRKMSRTVSSLGRLETSHSAGNALLELSRAYTKDDDSKSSKQRHLNELKECDGGGDSDKENWIPGTQVSRRRRMTTSTSHRLPRRSILAESYLINGKAHRNWNTVPNANRLRTMRDNTLKPGKSDAAAEDSVSDLCPEVSAFMAAAARDGGTSQDEDLDCIQGLLSLSQGAWR